MFNFRFIERIIYYAFLFMFSHCNGNPFASLDDAHTVLQKLMTCEREMKWLSSFMCLTHCVKKKNANRNVTGRPSDLAFYFKDPRTLSL